MTRRLSAVVLPALLAAVAAGCPQQDATPDRAPATPPPGAPAATPGDPAAAPGEMALAQQGREVFHGAGLCFSCHGQNGVGGPLGPALNDTDWLNMTTGSLEEIEAIVRTGVSQPVQYPAPMPPMGGARLSDEQVRSVSTYVYEISQGGR
jgi:mono/diheme cytochrome c family protein